jgi:hypothetical protein
MSTESSPLSVETKLNYLRFLEGMKVRDSFDNFEILSLVLELREHIPVDVSLTMKEGKCQ